MTTHKLKRRSIKQRSKKRNNKSNIKSKKERKKKNTLKGGIGYNIQGVTEKETAVDIIEELSEYEELKPTQTIYRYELWTSDHFINMIQNQGMSTMYELINKLSTSQDSLFQPQSKEGKNMVITAIYENNNKKINVDPIAQTGFDDFKKEVFGILNIMDKNQMTIYGDAVLLCKDLSYLNGGFIGDATA